MPKAFAASFSDFSGPTNPTGIWSPAFMALKLALDHGDTPDNVLQSLYDWLSQKKVEPSAVDKILDLPDAQSAYEALVGLIGGSGKLNPNAFPPIVQQTLHRAIKRIAQKHVERRTQELGAEQRRLDQVRSRFGGESAPQVVRRLLGS